MNDIKSTLIIISVVIILQTILILFEKRNKTTSNNIGDAIALIHAFNMTRERICVNNVYNYMLEDYDKYFWSFKTGIAIKPQFKKYVFEAIAESNSSRYDRIFNFAKEIHEIRGN